MDILQELGLEPVPDPKMEKFLEKECERVARDEHPCTRGEIKDFAKMQNLGKFGVFELHMRVCPKCSTIFTVDREVQIEIEKRDARRARRRERSKKNVVYS